MSGAPKIGKMDLEQALIRVQCAYPRIYLACHARHLGVAYDFAAQRVVEKNSMGELPYRILKLEAPRLLVTEIDGGKDLGFGGTWTLTVVPCGGGSTVRIVERGSVYSMLFRVVSKLFIPNDKSAKTYLEDLARAMN